MGTCWRAPLYWAATPRDRSLLARTALDPSIPRHRYSDFPLDYALMFCGDHSDLPGNITFEGNLLHILLSRQGISTFA